MSTPLLLNLLTDTPRPETELALALGCPVAQVQVWAGELEADGVPVNVTPDGLALLPGTPAPPLVRRGQVLGQALRYVGTLDSTQDEVKRWANDPLNPAPWGAVCVAERQTAGRGRRGRSWDTTHGTLAFSVLLGPELLGDGMLGAGMQQAGMQKTVTLLPLAVGVALREAVGVGGLKWPNDLLAPDGRKLAGILVEADLRGGGVRRAVLGIGLNVTAAPPAAACLRKWQPEVTRAEVLSKVLVSLEHWLSAPPDAVLRAWRAASLTLGQQVELRGAAASVAGREPVSLTGVALDIDDSGSLLVQDASGQVHTVTAGDVQLLGTWHDQAAP